ncbi:hypothetical protein M441DRAFT_47836 [Trichoderma asperellum CBS 433.97]|uniref:Secreted protein n=1 Tax=Trichoderma asperellum (strain ATCC 204424 / CBS 433.97 / NBRC 101777) TaxID=1042311 RepID=A0A2T3Z546_TRIA4|nr:hypothetical protein M441DRAFT_47836 [Trichoderma asperellum CBS 433.97]PTB39946.1 hypothetical protein M441DRAFT_47836 [Trichoderma asperellum CBS 433.97]
MVATSATQGVMRFSLLAVHLLIGPASVPNIEQGIVATTPVGSNWRTAMEFQEPVLLVSKSLLQRSPLGEARLQGLRAEVLVEIGCIGYRQIWHPWLGSRNTKAPIHRAITTQAVLQGVAAQTRSVQPAKSKLRAETDYQQGYSCHIGQSLCAMDCILQTMGGNYHFADTWRFRIFIP